MFGLPDHFGINIAETAGFTISLKALSDPIAMDSKIKYLETIAQLSEVAELHIVILVLAWLFSKYALDHWELEKMEQM